MRSFISAASASFEVRMIDAGQERNKGVNRVSALEASHEIVSEAHAQKGLFANMGEIFPAFSDIFSNDGRKEVGFLAIVAWHHSIAKLAARNQISIPPVLLSTISTLLGLSLIRKIKGRESTDRIVEYFDPSVEFLGTWMTLWLVPSLVLLPNALQKIKTPNRSMWLKLIITHFVLWCGSTVGSAKLYELIEGNTERKSSRDNDGNSGVIINALNGNNTASESVTSDATGIPSDVASFPSTISNCDGESSNCLESEADLVQVPSLLDTGSTSYDAVENNRSRAMADATASPDTSANVKKTEAGIKEEQFKKQLKLLRFWGAITACFYAAPLQGLMATTAPAIGERNVTSFRIAIIKNIWFWNVLFSAPSLSISVFIICRVIPPPSTPLL